jgi:hypothetical protein
VTGLFCGFGLELRLVSGDEGVDFFLVLGQKTGSIGPLTAVKVKFSPECLHHQ